MNLPSVGQGLRRDTAQVPATNFVTGDKIRGSDQTCIATAPALKRDCDWKAKNAPEKLRMFGFMQSRRIRII